MKHVMMYRVEDSERMLWRRIEEAFNMLVSFTPELNWTPKSNKDRANRPREQLAFAQVVVNKNFSWKDYEVLRQYGHTVAKRAKEKYTSTALKDAAWAESVLANANNLLGCMADLHTLMQDVLDGKTTH